MPEGFVNKKFHPWKKPTVRHSPSWSPKDPENQVGLHIRRVADTPTQYNCRRTTSDSSRTFDVVRTWIETHRFELLVHLQFELINQICRLTLYVATFMSMSKAFTTSCWTRNGIAESYVLRCAQKLERMCRILAEIDEPAWVVGGWTFHLIVPKNIFYFVERTRHNDTLVVRSAPAEQTVVQHKNGRKRKAGKWISGAR